MWFDYNLNGDPVWACITNGNPLESQWGAFATRGKSGWVLDVRLGSRRERDWYATPERAVVMGYYGFATQVCRKATTDALMRLSILAEMRSFLSVSTLSELAALRVLPEWEVALCIAESWHKHQQMLREAKFEGASLFAYRLSEEARQTIQQAVKVSTELARLAQKAIRAHSPELQERYLREMFVLMESK